MKKKWKIVLIAFAAGIILACIGLLGGAKTWFYINQTGVHLPENKEPQTVTEELMGFSNLRIVEDSSVKVVRIGDIYTDSFTVEILHGETYAIDIISNRFMPEYEVANDTLVVRIKRETQSGHYSFGFRSDSLRSDPKENVIKVYVPANTAMENINISNSFGDTKISDIQGENITIRSDNGRISMDDITAGMVNVHNVFGNTHITRLSCTDLDILSDNGNIQADGLTADSVKINNRFGKTNVSDLMSINIEIQSDNGDILADVLTADNIKLSNRFGNTRLNNVTSAGLKISSDNGDIYALGDLSGQTHINNRFGSTELNIIEKNDCYYMLSTRFGIIKFADKEQGDRMEIGAPGSANAVYIENDNGNILVGFVKP
jgi:DUF4097 and DUF4098 domain-containing protein YvlB